MVLGSVPQADEEAEAECQAIRSDDVTRGTSTKLQD